MKSRHLIAFLTTSITAHSLCAEVKSSAGAINLPKINTTQNVAILKKAEEKSITKGKDETLAIVAKPAAAKSNLPCWPTTNKAFFQGKPLSAFIQPTVSGRTISGTFGYVRNSGTRFHKGVDLFPLRRDKKTNEPKDKVRSVYTGKVMYINNEPHKSGYGRYVVLKHEDLNLPIYTLYAHLSKVNKSIAINKILKQGASIGQMGRSANHVIPKHRAHLHFEMGLRASESSFKNWYNSQNFKSKNSHGNWNGLNLISFDPLDFYKPKKTPLDYVRSLKTAYKLRVTTSAYPDFLQRYPNLLEGKRLSNRKGKQCYEVDFSWFNMPFKWRAVEDDKQAIGTIDLVHLNEDELKHMNRSVRPISVDKQGVVKASKQLDRYLKLLFGFKKYTCLRFKYGKTRIQKPSSVREK